MKFGRKSVDFLISTEFGGKLQNSEALTTLDPYSSKGLYYIPRSLNGAIEESGAKRMKIDETHPKT